MNILEIKVPLLSESISKAILLKWHKNIGETINIGDNLVSIETDKIILEIPSKKKGILKEIFKKNGSIINSREIIGLIDLNFKEKIYKQIKKNFSILKSKNNINNIVNDDINYKKDKLNNTKTVLMSNLRLRISERMIESKNINATLTTFNEANMQNLINIRKKYKDFFFNKHNIKLSFMSFFIKSAIIMLKEFPILNASVNNNKIIYHNYYNIGIAINTPKGLIVPVIKNADKMSLLEIEIKINDLIQKSKKNLILIDDLIDGTFTISNGGVYGSLFSTPIINPPQSSILGIHVNKKRPIVYKNKTKIKFMNYLSLSYDHRIIDGRDAILSLNLFVKIIENPIKLLLY